MQCEFELESPLKDYILEDLKIEENKQILVVYFLKKVSSDFDHEFGTEPGIDFEIENIHLWTGGIGALKSVFVDFQLKQRLKTKTYDKLFKEIESHSENYKIQLLEE